MTVFYRHGSWDQEIFLGIMRGEYGPLDVAGKLVVDVGAHIGSFSLLAAMRGARRVLAFEPGSVNFDYLQRNCAAYANVECTQAAVWAAQAPATELTWKPSSHADNTGGGSVIDCEAVAGFKLGAQGAELVQSIALDSIIASAGVVDLLKIDAEGSEYPILYGSRHLRKVRRIVGEYHQLQGARVPSSLSGQFAWSIEGLEQYLNQQGFAVTRANKGLNGFFQAVRTGAGP